MNTSDFFSPIIRRFRTVLVLTVVFFIGIMGLMQLIPTIHKTTLYFTVKLSPVIEGNTSYTLDEVEGASKIAEAISGWAKNPAFRNEILSTANVSISHFKRKIAARKQNRLNVFWTLKLSGDEAQYAETITQALSQTLQTRLQDFNAGNALQYRITTPTISQENQTIPFLIILLVAIILGSGFAIFTIYLYELFTSRVSYLSQVYDRFPDTPILRLSTHPSAHDTTTLERFVLTFDSPQLIGVFPQAASHFSLAPPAALDPKGDTPILLIQLGTTTTQDLENHFALYGDSVGIVVFER